MNPSEESTQLESSEVSPAAATTVPLVGHHAPTEIIGFHGCTQEAAESIFSSKTFRHSTRTYDWLGDGFYFWEYAPHRAVDWATTLCVKANDGSKPAVIRATIELRNCLNLLDTEHMKNLAQFYQKVVDKYNASNRPLPKNTSDGRHYLDRQVVNLYCELIEGITSKPLQTVRGCFPEGDPIYPDSKILGKTHVQIAVRDSTCIKEVSIL